MVYSMCREEFKQHGLSDIVTLTCQDVCTDGFHMVEVADAGNAGCVCGISVCGVHVFVVCECVVCVHPWHSAVCLALLPHFFPQLVCPPVPSVPRRAQAVGSY